MRIDDVITKLDNTWNDTANKWTDVMAEKYKLAIIDEAQQILLKMQQECTSIENISTKALSDINRIIIT